MAFFRITDIWQSVGAVITVAYYCKTWQLDINHMYPMYEREKEKHGKGEFLMYNVWFKSLGAPMEKLRMYKEVTLATTAISYVHF